MHDGLVLDTGSVFSRDRLLPVSQGDQVAVHLAQGGRPGHAEEVHTTVVADSDLANRCRDWGERGGSVIKRGVRESGG